MQTIGKRSARHEDFTLNPADVVHDPPPPRIQMAFACEAISQDTFQRISFNNLIDDLSAIAFPTRTLQFFTVFGVESAMPRFLTGLRVTVDGPTGRIAEQQLQDMALTPNRNKARMICGFPGITWPQAGVYEVQLHSGDAVIASFTIKLNQIIAGPQIPPQPPGEAPQ